MLSGFGVNEQAMEDSNEQNKLQQQDEQFYSKQENDNNQFNQTLDFNRENLEQKIAVQAENKKSKLAPYSKEIKDINNIVTGNKAFTDEVNKFFDKYPFADSMSNKKSVASKTIHAFNPSSEEAQDFKKFEFLLGTKGVSIILDSEGANSTDSNIIRNLITVFSSKK